MHRSDLGGKRQCNKKSVSVDAAAASPPLSPDRRQQDRPLWTSDRGDKGAVDKGAVSHFKLPSTII